jgi:cation diffusion facilitator CzcD-associated flavoprotein CzcO
LRGKTIAVVGTGSTSTQLVPELAKIAGRVHVFQREPGWIIPKGERDYTPDERRRLVHPLWYWLDRLKWYWNAEKRQWRGEPFRPGSTANDLGQQQALAFIERELGDRPDLQKAVTPQYPFWGKRLIFNSLFYAALKEPNVELVSAPVTAVTTTGVIDADGVERPVDVLVMATGFLTTDYLGTMQVRGVDGRSLQEYWAGEPRAFLGLSVPNFPNFYMLYGPGTNGGEIVSMLMTQARHVVRTAKRMRHQDVTAVEVKGLWADVFNAWLQAVVEKTAWATSSNYYKGPTGKVVTQWPSSPGIYALLVRALGRVSHDGRRGSS